MWAAAAKLCNEGTGFEWGPEFGIGQKLDNSELAGLRKHLPTSVLGKNKNKKLY